MNGTPEQERRWAEGGTSMSYMEEAVEAAYIAVKPLLVGCVPGRTRALNEQLQAIINAAEPVIRSDERARLEALLLSDGAEAMARKEYELHQDEMGYETVWEEETQGHRNIWLDAAKERLGLALTTLACHPTADGGDRNLIAITPEEYSELERYRAVFGDLCWTCGGSGDVPGAFDDDTSGGTKVCPGCNGRGTK